MENNPIQQYKEQSVNTMTPTELLLLLYDELVKHLVRCELALQKADYEQLEASADRSMDIVQYLDDTLDRQYPIANDLHRLYDYFGYQLGRVKIGRNKEVLGTIKPMILDLRESFRTAEKNCAEQGQLPQAQHPKEQS